MDIGVVKLDIFTPTNTNLEYAREHFKFSSEIFQHISPLVENITFINCEFKGKEILFESIKNSKLTLRFIDCSFECYLNINDCHFNNLHFIDIKKTISSFNIYGCVINRFYFKSREKEKSNLLNGNIRICDNKILEHANLENLMHVSGSFEFTNNRLESNNYATKGGHSVSFRNATLSNCIFSDTFFGKEANFDQAKFVGENSFTCSDSNFEKAYFNGTNFGKIALFNGSIFSSKVIMYGCKELNHTIADFSGCSFKDDVYFDYSEFKSITIKNVIFSGKTSFSNCIFQELTLNQLIFEKPAFFDDIKILNLKSCDRKTLRIIKQELQRTDNRIDYNNFKAYELDAYKKELGNSQWKDKFILCINSYSSNHGLNWLKGLKFTILVGFIFYLFYFLLEHHRRKFEISFSSINFFIIGYFKYLIPTYKSPFLNGLQIGVFYLPFLIGKIFIGYGIYQTIASFRKFRL